MNEAYFTFGQQHRHIFGGCVLDKDVVVRIIAKDPRDVMWQLFGAKWSMQYDEQPDMRLYKATVTIDLSEL